MSISFPQTQVLPLPITNYNNDALMEVNKAITSIHPSTPVMRGICLLEPHYQCLDEDNINSSISIHVGTKKVLDFDTFTTSPLLA